MNPSNREQDTAQKSHSGQSQSGKIKVKFFWKTSLLISIILTIVGTLILNLLLNG